MRGHLGRRARDLPVDLVHHVEGRVVDGEVVAERERARHRHLGGRERGQHLVLARHVVRGRQHVPERRAAQHPLARASIASARSVYVRFDRPPEISAAVSGHRRTFDVGGEPGLEPIEVDSLGRVGHAGETTCAAAACSRASARRRSCDSRTGSRFRRCGSSRGRDGCAVAARVPGDPADGHVDTEAGGGALFFRLATPEAVLAVLACPARGTRERRRTCGRRRGRWLHARPGPRAVPPEVRRTAVTARGRRPRSSTSVDH